MQLVWVTPTALQKGGAGSDSRRHSWLWDSGAAVVSTIRLSPVILRGEHDIFCSDVDFSNFEKAHGVVMFTGRLGTCPLLPSVLRPFRLVVRTSVSVRQSVLTVGQCSLLPTVCYTYCLLGGCLPFAFSGHFFSYLPSCNDRRRSWPQTPAHAQDGLPVRAPRKRSHTRSCSSGGFLCASHCAFSDNCSRAV